MRNIWIIAFAARAAAVAFLALPAVSIAADVAANPAAVAGAKHRVVLQVSDDNPKTWNQALNVIENVQQAYGKQNVDVELVAFGFGLGILKLDSVAGGRVQDAVASGAKIRACEVTMRRQKLTQADMLPNIGYVPAGVVEIITKQGQGWAVIRP
jgi:intracellular sulfur oxidation DsrE/DsrF family protein